MKRPENFHEMTDDERDAYYTKRDRAILRAEKRRDAAAMTTPAQTPYAQMDAERARRRIAGFTDRDLASIAKAGLASYSKRELAAVAAEQAERAGRTAAGFTDRMLEIVAEGGRTYYTQEELDEASAEQADRAHAAAYQAKLAADVAALDAESKATATADLYAIARGHIMQTPAAVAALDELFRRAQGNA